jgi:hypothetical protein
MRRLILIATAAALAVLAPAASARYVPYAPVEATLCSDGTCVQGTAKVFVRDGQFSVERFAVRGGDLYAVGKLSGRVATSEDPPGMFRLYFFADGAVKVRSLSGSCRGLALQLGPSPVAVEDHTFSVRSIAPVVIPAGGKLLCVAARRGTARPSPRELAGVLNQILRRL